MKRLPVGISSFKEVIEKDYYYIDKTLLIKEFLDIGSKVTLLPRPRRFGKTLNLSMLNYFFSNTEQAGYLFTNTAIAQHPDTMAHQGKYPVIFITFKDIKVSNWPDAYDKIQDLIRSEYNRLQETLNTIMTPAERSDYDRIIERTASKTVLEQSLQVLCNLLHRRYQKKVIILLDEYDAPIHAAFTHGYYQEMVECIRNLLSAALKDNNFLELGVLTGILRTAKEGIFSGLNNLNVCTILQQNFSDKFGFTESEVNPLLTAYNLIEKSDVIKKWYNGYQFAGTTIYNPWSILMCANNQGALAPYWTNTSDNALIKKLLTHASAELQESLQEILNGKPMVQRIDDAFIFPSMHSNEMIVWSLFVFSGYLTTTQQELIEGRYMGKLVIPNQEIRLIYEDLLTELLKEPLAKASIEIRLLAGALARGDGQAFEEILREYVLNSMSMFDIPKNESEKSYHLFVLGILVTLRDRYEVNSNRESAYGRYDVILIPKITTLRGIIIEFKHVRKGETLDSASNNAITQIIEKNYVQVLRQRDVKEVTAFGISFQGKKLLLKQRTL
jgi:predicted AAA-ATPase/PD-(D/E)XK nuclease superfamily protein